MTVQYCSDLHLEFRENKEFLEENPIVPSAEILLMAGDIVPFPLLKKHSSFFDFVSGNFEAVYWVPGNHEYYHSDIAERSGTVREEIRKNVFLTNNDVVHHGDTRFVFTTLWSKIGPANQWKIQQGMRDFFVINYNDRVFTVSDFNEQHEKCKQFLLQELTKNLGKTVVVTHHAPTMTNYPEKYKGDVLNEAFACELFEIIEQHGPNYWVYGHHHQPIEPFQIGRTTLLVNQLGYVRYDEHTGFSGSSFINI